MLSYLSDQIIWNETKTTELAFNWMPYEFADVRLLVLIWYHVGEVITQMSCTCSMGQKGDRMMMTCRCWRPHVMWRKTKAIRVWNIKSLVIKGCETQSLITTDCKIKSSVVNFTIHYRLWNTKSPVTSGCETQIIQSHQNAKQSLEIVRLGQESQTDYVTQIIVIDCVAQSHQSESLLTVWNRVTNHYWLCETGSSITSDGHTKICQSLLILWQRVTNHYRLWLRHALRGPMQNFRHWVNSHLQIFLVKDTVTNHLLACAPVKWSAEYRP